MSDKLMEDFYDRELREYEIDFKPQMEEIIRREFQNNELTNRGFRKLYYTGLDLWDREENGSPETQEKQRKRDEKAIHYLAYVLRNDLDGSWYGHPYPRAISQRMKNIWELAQLFYFLDDPNGFLGPSAAELIYILRAMTAARIMGNTDFDDLLEALYGKYWATHLCDVKGDKLLDESFQTWYNNKEFDWMFNHRGTKEEWETRTNFTTHDQALERAKRKRKE